jgi:mannitol/fructose-specific phosphotransferase system IIA component (Ntr-type)
LTFLLAVPNHMSADAYIAVLARLARLLIHEEFRESLYHAKNYKDVIKAVKEGEELLVASN